MSVEKWSRKQRRAFERTIAARVALGKKALKLAKQYHAQIGRLIRLETKGKGKR